MSALERALKRAVAHSGAATGALRDAIAQERADAESTVGKNEIKEFVRRALLETQRARAAFDELEAILND